VAAIPENTLSIPAPEESGENLHATLVILSGLPGVGKTAIARELASRIGAVYLRIDSIEQVMRSSQDSSVSLDDAGYRIAYAIAEDNLRIGLTVIADSVNPIQLTRDAWVEVARRAAVCAIEVEIQCTDLEEHRRRVETRATDVPGLRLPTWEEVISRQYTPWNREHLVLDTATSTLARNVEAIRVALRSSSPGATVLTR
jgi:predicted kinase